MVELFVNILPVERNAAAAVFNTVSDACSVRPENAAAGGQRGIGRRDAQLPAAEAEAEKLLRYGAEIPAGRAGVPGPAGKTPVSRG